MVCERSFRLRGKRRVRSARAYSFNSKTWPVQPPRTSTVKVSERTNPCRSYQATSPTAPDQQGFRSAGPGVHRRAANELRADPASGLVAIADQEHQVSLAQDGRGTCPGAG